MAKRSLAPSRRSAAAARAERAGRAAAARAMALLRRHHPQMWVQAQRLGKLLEIQQQVPGGEFPVGHCFLHANLASVNSFCVRQVREVNLDTFQVSLEIHADEDLEAGIVVLPLEAVQWFGFPAKAVPVGVHFQGFTGFDAIVPASPRRG